MISLDWGATLYTTDTLTDMNSKKIKVNSQSKVSVDQKWRKSSSSLMTSMVVTLDLIKVVTEALDSHSSDWKVKHVDLFMKAIELAFWHARSFNDNYALRSQLQRRGFMQRIDTSILPHLLEQEINSISLIQFVIMKCYGIETGNMFGDHLNVLKSFAQPWIQRSVIVFF